MLKGSRAAGVRVTADLPRAVYGHVIGLSPEFFETTQTGEVLSRLTTDTTLIQTVMGSSLSLGLRNALLTVGGVGMLVVTSPVLSGYVIATLIVVVAPAVADIVEHTPRKDHRFL